MKTATIQSFSRFRLVALGVLAGAVLAMSPALRAAEADRYATDTYVQVEPATGESYFYSDAELDELVGPVALYPDDLVAIVLPASTYPLQVVEAARFLDRLEQDGSLRPPGHWDDSIVALLNYPEVLTLLNDEPSRTWQLGEAVLNQRPEVLAAVERFRGRAYDAGNLHSDEHQIVEVIDEYIEIVPADPEVIYVPYYDPERVVVYQTVPVYRYYPRPYPVYYYPYPAGYRFRSTFFWGISNWFSIGWSTLHLHVHGFGHNAHPYYGQHYYEPFYRSHYYQASRNHYSSHHGSERNHNADHRWVPGPRHGARPVQHGATTASTSHFRGNGDRDNRVANVAPVRSPAPAARPDIDRRDPENTVRTTSRDPRARSGQVPRASDDRKPQSQARPSPDDRDREPVTRTPQRTDERTPDRRPQQAPARTDHRVIVPTRTAERAPERRPQQVPVRTDRHAVVPERSAERMPQPRPQPAPDRVDRHASAPESDRSRRDAARPAEAPARSHSDSGPRAQDRPEEAAEAPKRPRKESRGNGRRSDRESR